MNDTKRDQWPPTKPQTRRNASSASASKPRRMCQTIALPPILAVTTEPMTVAASSQ